MAGILKVGDTFESYQALDDAVDQYGNTNRVQYWKRDSKRLHRATPRVYEIAKNHPQLEYYSVRFTCIHGGQPFRPKFKFQEKKCRKTWKQDCKAQILVGLNDDKSRLVVKKIINEHNHEIPSEEMFQQYPKNRRKTFTKTKATRPANRALVKSPETIQILDNIVKTSSLARSNNFQRLANVLAENHDCTVHLQADDDDKIIGFFFQDSHMLRYFEAFPEILLIDGSCRLQNMNCCVYILSTECSAGSSDVVAVAVLTVEEKDSVDWMFERFKESNSKWEDVTMVVADRLTTQYRILQDHFPQARRVICPSHAFQTFKKDTQPSKTMRVMPEECEEACGFFKKLMEARNEEAYQTILEEMEDSLADPLMEYFYGNWHKLRSEWVKSSTVGSINGNFDTLNYKFRSAIANCKSFSKFIENFFAVLNTKRYSQQLTSYATDKFKSALNQLDSDTITFDDPNDDLDTVCHSPDGTFVVSEISCNCANFTTMKLPCVHLLAYRKHKRLDLFDPYLFSKRWTRKYFLEFCSNVGDTGAGRPTAATSAGKFELAKGVCLSLAGLCGEVGDGQFEARMEVLKKLREVWENGEEAAVERVTAKREHFDHDYVGMGSL